MFTLLGRHGLKSALESEQFYRGMIMRMEMLDQRFTNTPANATGCSRAAFNEFDTLDGL